MITRIVSNGVDEYVYTVRNPSDEELAKETIHTLHEFYPGHKWWVLIDGGVRQIKNRDFSCNWGMVEKLSNINQDAIFRRRSVIRGAGEFLERAHQRRGEFQEPATGVEGIPQHRFGR